MQTDPRNHVCIHSDAIVCILSDGQHTLRYRLARISELTGCDLRDANTRFNLHAATRSWRFLYPQRTR
ncbi:helix-turn-helix domain-containing protein [Mycobacterium sp. SMC-8]|uniref:helix-turn-helix domain-containing protein n=1 Tax=Mycobacterium sp. SMC-8 TaxID=2857060 RepID=UPI0021B4A742|nr:helix-turn-helix domain-containing protein [Mycobacterium sp. SMC-8]UXA11049.1 helix-turn-helix domain-containing protein [Mycobacterium sp. SMC-8]